MRIAFLIYTSAMISGKSNGIRSQALTWKRILEEHGEEVVLISNWGDYDWSSFDALHLFGYDIGIYTLVDDIRKVNDNIFLSPIIDSNKPYWLYGWAGKNGFDKMRLFSLNYALQRASKLAKGICVRSHHERGYFTKSFRIAENNVFLIPLSYGILPPKEIDSVVNDKENYCLHVSSLYQERKNVKNLIDASSKYNFKLILAGSLGNSDQEAKVRDWASDAPKVEVLGYVTYEKLLELYSKAKVFALPSISEGVGIVALDAAVYGCNIALTGIKGPKEYYANIETVNVMKGTGVDDIGESVMKMMAVENDDRLHYHIMQRYSKDHVYKLLIKMYKRK